LLSKRGPILVWTLIASLYIGNVMLPRAEPAARRLWRA